MPKGKIKVSGYRRSAHKRSGYKRSDGTYISPTRVEAHHVDPYYREDVGAPGKTKEIRGGGETIPVKEGELSQHGYEMSDPPRKRRAALREAIDEDGATTVYRRLLALRNFREDTAEAYAKRNNCSIEEAREATKGAKPVPKSVNKKRYAEWQILNRDMKYIKDNYNV